MAAKKPFPWWILIIVALVLLGGAAVFALTRGGGKPGTPQIAAPVNGFPIPAVPATLQVVWSAAKKADKYEVQVQKCSASPCTDANATDLNTDSTTETSANVAITQPVSGRVRVVALKGSTKGDPSDWRSFAFVGTGGGGVIVDPVHVCLKCVIGLLQKNPTLKIDPRIKNAAEKVGGG